MNLADTKQHAKVFKVVSHSGALNVRIHDLLFKEPEGHVLDVGNTCFHHLFAMMEVEEVFFGDFARFLFEHDVSHSVGTVDFESFFNLV